MGASAVGVGRPGVGGVSANGAGAAAVFAFGELGARLGAVEAPIQRVLEDGNLLFGETG